ncbi:hypothetical protein J4230_00195 [Candidatus Woesearchaeota archaeon]|nr:hypothetical protein [Candidatus Woesearchaeota archaeon]
MTISDYEKTRVLEIYSRAEGSITKARELLTEDNIFVSVSTIRNYWVKAIYKINKPGGKRFNGRPIDEITRRTIIRAYNMYDGNLSRAARMLGYSQDRIKQVWTEERKLKSKGNLEEKV